MRKRKNCFYKYKPWGQLLLSCDECLEKETFFLFKIIYNWKTYFINYKLQTKREKKLLPFSFSIPINVIFKITWWLGSNRLSEISVSFIFFKKGGIAYINCCHLKLGKLWKLLKANFSLILLQDLIFRLLSNNW